MIADSTAPRAQELAARFERRFAAVPRVYRAPGRVNLIGEHTDYNEGYVLPFAVGLSCYVAAAPRGDRLVVVESPEVGRRTEWSLDDPEPPPRASWGHYVIGVAAMLRRLDRGLCGATLLVSSDLPIGAGLGSSAAIEVAAALALADLAGLTIPDRELPRLCQQAEAEFVGARVGIMDPFVATHARPGHALLLDCRCLEYRPVPLPADVRIVACNTRVRHCHAGDEYNRRRAECEAGMARLAARFPGIRSLRDADQNRLEACRDELPEAVFRRCRHVVAENGRVLSFVRALERGRIRDLGPLMSESHRSLRDDYQVSCPELEAMLEAADAAPGSLGARMTGGGFGGCIVSLVRRDRVDTFRASVTRAYAAATGREPEIHAVDAGDRAARVL